MTCFVLPLSFKILCQLSYNIQYLDGISLEAVIWYITYLYIVWGDSSCVTRSAMPNAIDSQQINKFNFVINL